MKRVSSTVLGLATLAACASKTPPTETAAGALTGVEALEADNPVKPLPTIPIVGCSSVGQLRESIAACSIRLSPEELRQLKEA